MNNHVLDPDWGFAGASHQTGQNRASSMKVSSNGKE